MWEAHEVAQVDDNVSLRVTGTSDQTSASAGEAPAKTAFTSRRWPRLVSTEPEREVLREERALQSAMVAGDVPALDRLLHPELLAVGPTGS